MIRFNANTSERSMKKLEQREDGRPHERATHALAQRTFWELVLADDLDRKTLEGMTWGAMILIPIAAGCASGSTEVFSNTCLIEAMAAVFYAVIQVGNFKV